MLGRLEAVFDAQRRFIADASHELRTPLTIIRSLGENALQQPHTPAHYADTISSMLEETERLAQLLDGLLTLTRAEAGQLPLNKERVDLVALAEEVTSCLCVLAEEKQQQLQLDGNAAAHTVADHATLRQALINLVANAIRYTPEHGSIRVTVRSHPQYGGSLIEVSDNGPGIAAEHQGKVFERFYRIEADRSRASGGAGLGLALARWFAELNGGVIELESQPGRGCLFRIRLEQTGPA
jgi:signal transduction histidine kinase